MSYTQIYLHCIFATKYRQYALHPQHDDELQKYITGIVQDPSRQCKILAINNVEDHLHMLVCMHPSCSPAKLMQEVKAVSSKFINESGWYTYKFQWQIGYGCFSYAQSEVKTVCNYIHRQKQHHKKMLFQDEYL
jgi:REP element-mobilizing transposase RayT